MAGAGGKGEKKGLETTERDKGSGREEGAKGKADDYKKCITQDRGGGTLGESCGGNGGPRRLQPGGSRNTPPSIRGRINVSG